MLLALVVLGFMGFWHGRQMYALGREHILAELRVRARPGELRVIQGGKARRRRAQ